MEKARKQVKNFFRVSAEEFSKIPGSPIAYWVNQSVLSAFEKGTPLHKMAHPRKGMVTADNERFIRYWVEIAFEKIGFSMNGREQAKKTLSKWFPYTKGGEFRRWYGNFFWVVNWENDGFELLNMKKEGYKVGSTNHNLSYIFKPAITWTKITSSSSGFRVNFEGFLFDDSSGLCPPAESKDLFLLLGMLNTPISTYLLNVINPTLNLNPGNLSIIPFIPPLQENPFPERSISLSKSDWDSFETSWDFTTLPLLSPTPASWPRETLLSEAYAALRQHWVDATLEMQRLEEQNNRIFIDAYGLEQELSPDVPLEEITLTCNPYYRYGNKVQVEQGSDEKGKTFPFHDELEKRLRADTVKELVSYAVGCMLGRYSLDRPGLVLANQGETLDDYLQLVPNPTFTPDKDNVVPILEGEWFPDDIVQRFRRFLRLTMGDEHFQQNLEFVEDALGKDIRKYFLRDFFNDHVTRYKKRPIYWLFSSPKGSFNALVYMHRYRSDTVSVVLNDYLRPFRAKLAAQLDALQKQADLSTTSKSGKTRALKEVEKVKAMLKELASYEEKVLYPLATRRVEIDLDDGVKVNYPKLGDALKSVKGL